jgi:RNA polymerase-binding protein DksA
VKPEERAALRTELQARRDTLLRSLPHLAQDEQVEREARDGDGVDRVVRQQSAELLRSLADAERRELEDVDAALLRLDRGAYGRCEACAAEIPVARLRARPEVRTCLDCAPRRAG